MSIARNIYAKPIRIPHAELERADDVSVYRSVCPVCHVGLLLVQRDQETLQLLAGDNCTLCGQPIVYTDIESMRQKYG